MNNYNIYAGLGGSFGGAEYQGTLKDVTEKEAEEYAYEMAWEIFESYEDGLCSWEDFEEEYPEGTDDDYDEFRKEQMENWSEYYVVLTDDDDISPDNYVILN